MKYIIDFLIETGMFGCKPSEISVETGKRYESMGKQMDRDRYQKLVGKLIYLSHTRPDIFFIVNVVSQYMHSPEDDHL